MKRKPKKWPGAPATIKEKPPEISPKRLVASPRPTFTEFVEELNKRHPIP